MIDIHCHILPGIDDGARNPDISRSLLNEEKKQGAKAVFFTPHFYPHETSLEEFVKNRRAALNNISDILTEELGIKTFPGAEVAFDKVLFNYTDIGDLCLGGSKYILIELSFSKKWSKNLYARIEKLIEVYGVQPIIAHIERYPAVKSSFRCVKKLLKSGCLLQADGAVSEDVKERKILKKLAKKKQIHFYGSDAHNTEKRKPAYFDFRDFILSVSDESLLASIEENSEEIINEIENGSTRFMLD